MKYFTHEFLKFFIELAPNNNKDWFDANRDRYETSVKQPFKKFVDDLILALTKKDASFKGLESKDCIFRINRDIRFSKDKTPYKTMVSAIVSPGGRKDHSKMGLYIELTPEHVRVYGGLYEPDKEQIQEIREGISSKMSEFKKAYSDKEFVAQYGNIRGEKNKILAAEFKANAEKEPLLFNKQWYYFSEFKPELVTTDKLLETVVSTFDAAAPVRNFFQKIIH